jgi:hypothetical protein
MNVAELITIDTEQTEIRARLCANAFWNWNFDTEGALDLLSNVAPELLALDGFEKEFRAEWDRLWDAPQDIE